MENPVPVPKRYLFGAAEEHSNTGTTPNIEPFPGLNENAIPVLNMSEVTKANLKLNASDMFLLSRIDGTLPMGDVEDLCGEASPLRLQSLIMRLWRAGIITFRD